MLLRQRRSGAQPIIRGSPIPWQRNPAGPGSAPISENRSLPYCGSWRRFRQVQMLKVPRCRTPFAMITIGFAAFRYRSDSNTTIEPLASSHSSTRARLESCRKCDKI